MNPKNNHWLDKYQFDDSIGSDVKDIIKKYTANYPTNVEKIINECSEFYGIEYKDLGEGISGMIMKADDDDERFVITVNKRHRYIRQRFTIARQFARYILYKKLIGDGIVDDDLYRSEEFSGSNYAEVEANRLAADILMPLDQIHKLAGEGDSIRMISQKLKVSTLALKIRLGILYDNVTDSIEDLLNLDK